MIYLDEILVLNFTADYLLLLTTARTLGEPLRRKRFALTAIFGAIYAAVVELSAVGWLTKWWMKLLFALLMVRIAFRGRGKLLRQYLLFLLISSGFAGVEMALFGFSNSAVPFSLPLFLGTFAVCYLIMGVTFRGSGRNAVRGLLIPVTVEYEGKRLSFTALLDSGCALADPGSGEAALIVQKETLQPLLREKMPVYDTELSFENLSGTGVLRGFYCDMLQVGRRRLAKALILVYEGRFSGNHQALWGGETEGSGSDETVCLAERVGKTLGLAANRAGAVYRRQRYPAAASQQRGRSGTADEITGGIGAKNADRAESAACGIHRKAV